MSDHNIGKVLLLFFILATLINFSGICYFAACGDLSISDFFMDCMIWFYGTIIVIDHIEPDDSEDDKDDDDYVK